MITKEMEIDWNGEKVNVEVGEFKIKGSSEILGLIMDVVLDKDMEKLKKDVDENKITKEEMQETLGKEIIKVVAKNMDPFLYAGLKKAPFDITHDNIGDIGLTDGLRLAVEIVDINKESLSFQLEQLSQKD